jgi:hypothetical protein
MTKISQRSSEADVVKVFSLFIMYPVEVALMQIKVPDSCHLEFRCEVHPEKGREVRVDMILKLKETVVKAGKTISTFKTLAVMEMKNFGVIKDEMGHILAAKVASVQQAKKLAPTSKVRFHDDSMLLLRQCAAYATQYKTRHVALCDWSVAVYLDFAQLPEILAAKEEKDGGKGKTGKDEGGNAGQYVLLYTQTDPQTFHYALLAFFKGAVDEWLQSI